LVGEIAPRGSQTGATAKRYFLAGNQGNEGHHDSAVFMAFVPLVIFCSMDWTALARERTCTQQNVILRYSSVDFFPDCAGKKRLRSHANAEFHHKSHVPDE